MEDTPWTIQNGFLTGTEKKRRKLLQARYSEKINILYEQINQNGQSSDEGNQLSKEFLELLRDFIPSGKPEEFNYYIENHLVIYLFILSFFVAANLSGTMTLGSIGGDSLSAARLCHSLQNRGVEVQLRNIFEYL